MTILLLLALGIIFIDCRSLSSNKALRAVDSPDEAGLVADEYAGFVSSTNGAPDPFDAPQQMSESENIIKANPDDPFSSTIHPKQPGSEPTRIVADDRYPPRDPICLPGWRLACCMPRDSESSSQLRNWPGEDDFPDVPEIPKCIWETDFHPETALPGRIRDWCNDEFLACCVVNPRRVFPVVEECVFVNSPETSPSRSMCGLHPRRTEKRTSDGCEA